MDNSSTRVQNYRRGQAAAVTERGAVLFMSLVILLIITVLGLSSLQTTFMQEHMARNSYDNNLAFQAAEAAIRDAEWYLSNSITSLDPFTAASANTEGLYIGPAYPLPPHWHNIDWRAANGVYRTAPGIAAIAAPPKYIIESITIPSSAANPNRLNLNNIGQDTGHADCGYVFRVTAYASGATDTEQVMIQSTYGKCF